MVVRNDHIREVLMLRQRSSDPVPLLFETILNSPFDEAFCERAIKLLAKQTPPERFTAELAKEMRAQATAIIWILGPIWVASERLLPRVTGEEFKEVLGNEPRIDWDKFFAQFSSYNATWQKCVDIAMNSLTMGSSRITVGRICRAILSRLEPPMV